MGLGSLGFRFRRRVFVEFVGRARYNEGVLSVLGKLRISFSRFCRRIVMLGDVFGRIF